MSRCCAAGTCSACRAAEAVAFERGRFPVSAKPEATNPSATDTMARCSSYIHALLVGWAWQQGVQGIELSECKNRFLVRPGWLGHSGRNRDCMGVPRADRTDGRRSCNEIKMRNDAGLQNAWNVNVAMP